MRHPDAAALDPGNVTIGIHDEILHVAARLEAVVRPKPFRARIEAHHLLGLGEGDPEHAVARGVDLVRATRLARRDAHRHVVCFDRTGFDVDAIELVAGVNPRARPCPPPAPCRSRNRSFGPAGYSRMSAGAVGIA